MGKNDQVCFVMFFFAAMHQNVPVSSTLQSTIFTPTGLSHFSLEFNLHVVTKVATFPGIS